MASSLKQCSGQLSLAAISPEIELILRSGQPYKTEFLPNANDYDRIIVAFSGGKDSLAAVLLLRWLGVPNEKIELWHHCVDGREGSMLMDWACTEGYCAAIAKALNLPIYFSWREGGFEREMLRDQVPTAVTYFETPDGLQHAGGNSSQTTTRLRFPQTGSIQSGRWCSALMKIDVSRISLRNQERFNHSRTLFVSGERREESAARSQYLAIEEHSADARTSNTLSRVIDHWRPVIAWDEVEVWRVIQEFGINPHPCYKLGFGRCSCRNCIFGSNDQWATLRLIDPVGFNAIMQYEQEFGWTIHRTLSVAERADLGTPYAPLDPIDIAAAFDANWTQPIVLSPQTWKLPLGGFGDATGPT